MDSLLLPLLDGPVGLLQEDRVGGGRQARDHAAPEPEHAASFCDMNMERLEWYALLGEELPEDDDVLGHLKVLEPAGVVEHGLETPVQ